MTILLWLAELLIETVGAWFALKRRNWALFPLLAFLSVSDLALLILGATGLNTWQLAWVQHAGKYGLMILLAAWICGSLVQAERVNHVRLAAATLALLGSAVVVRVFSDGVTLKDRLLDAENAANIFLAALIAVGWISRRQYLKAPWTMIAAGLLVAVGSDLVCTMLWSAWEPAWRLYPLGEIAAYALWCWSMIRNSAENVELRLSLEPRIPSKTLWLDTSSKMVN